MKNNPNKTPRQECEYPGPRELHRLLRLNAALPHWTQEEEVRAWLGANGWVKIGAHWWGNRSFPGRQFEWSFAIALQARRTAAARLHAVGWQSDWRRKQCWQPLGPRRAMSLRRGVAIVWGIGKG